jgi:hypothetical protein
MDLYIHLGYWMVSMFCTTFRPIFIVVLRTSRMFESSRRIVYI